MYEATCWLLAVPRARLRICGEQLSRDPVTGAEQWVDQGMLWHSGK